MVIERPDLRRSNEALFREVQQVWEDIEAGTIEPKVKGVSYSLQSQETGARARVRIGGEGDPEQGDDGAAGCSAQEGISGSGTSW
jgi:hypothetical protein